MTAFVNNAMNGSFDNQLPFGTSSFAPHLEAHAPDDTLSPSHAFDDSDSYDALNLQSLWSHPHALQRQYLAFQSTAQPIPAALNPALHHPAAPHTPHTFGDPPSTASNTSAYAPSTTSSVRGSPLARSSMANAPHPVALAMGMSHDNQMTFDAAYTMSMPDGSMPDFSSAAAGDRLSGFVDPSLLQPSSGGNTQPAVSFSVQPPSVSAQPPPLVHNTSTASSRSGSQHFKKSRSNSPFLQSSQAAWQPYPQTADARKISSHSFGGPHGNGSSRSDSSEAEDNDKGRCPFTDCGKVFKDLKAHMLTHQNERPEKCPIPSCEYNKKGFSRKYDKNRHTLTHYKGTMICGFCPGSGSAAEKSFNRADVFKRHLTTVHNVEQAPPNSKRKQAAASKKDVHKAPGTTGKCSICSKIFQTPQDFYEHLEECVLDVVQKVDPGEAINEAILSSMADDKDTNETIKRHAIVDHQGLRDADGESDDENEDQEDGNSRNKLPS